MVVLTLSACPPKLRGDVTKWMVEVSPGVYVGLLSQRVRENLWTRVCSLIGTGKATMIYPAQTEQRFSVKTYGTYWTPVDFDGITLMKHPVKQKVKNLDKTD